METNPIDPFHIGEPGQQLVQIPLAVDVEAIVSKVLCDQDQFLGAVGRQLPRTLHQFLHGRADVLAAHEGNGAEGTFAVAALAHLEVGEVRRRGQQPLPHQLMLVIGLERFQQPRQVARAEPGIDLRNALLQLGCIALAQAAGDVHFFHQALVLGLGVSQDHIDAFLLGVVDEAAGIDHHHIVVAALGLVVHRNVVRL